MVFESVAAPPMIDLPRLLQAEGGDGEGADDNSNVNDDRVRHNSTVGESNANIFGSYERGCYLSNDPPADDSQIPELTVCNLTSYMCRAEPTPVEVLFDYELHYNPEADLQRILNYFEEVSLEHLATKLGLRNCTASFSTAGNGAGRRRRLEGDDGSGAENDGRNHLAGINLLPRDRPDDQHTNCIVPVDNNNANESSSGANSICLPTRGALTVYTKRNDDGSLVTASQAEAIQALILAELQRGMDEDLYVTKLNIEKMSFVGNRTAREAGESSSNRTSTTGVATSPPQVLSSNADSQATGRGMAPSMIGLVAGVVLLMLIVLAAFTLVARRRKKKRRDRGLDRDVEASTIPPDWHVPADLGLGTPVQGALAVRDSLALRPQDYSSWPGDDYTAANSLYTPGATGSPPRLLMSPSGGESPLKPPSQFTSRRSLASFDSTFAGTDTVCSDLTNNDRSLSLSQNRQLGPSDPTSQHSVPQGVAGERRQNGVYYIEPHASLGSASYGAAEDADVGDSGSERSARRTLQMT
jgi:hypothetical protein